MTSHVYLSTACLHGRHDRCDSMIGVDGTKRPATCKYCDAQCTCPHHDADHLNRKKAAA